MDFVKLFRKFSYKIIYLIHIVRNSLEVNLFTYLRHYLIILGYILGYRLIFLELKNIFKLIFPCIRIFFYFYFKACIFVFLTANGNPPLWREVHSFHTVYIGVFQSKLGISFRCLFHITSERCPVIAVTHFKQSSKFAAEMAVMCREILTI